MADKKTSPPWLLAVFTAAILLLVLGSLARYGDRDPHRRRRDPPAEGPSVTQRHTASPSLASNARPPAVAALAAAPDPKAQASDAPSAVQVHPAPGADRLQVHASGGVEGRSASDGFTAEVVSAPQGRVRGGRKIDLQGWADRSTSRKVLPWITEGALALMVGVVFGFLTRKEIMTMLGVSLGLGVMVAALEWLGQTNIAWSSLWDYATRHVWAAPGTDTVTNIVQKAVSAGLIGTGYFMGTKG